MSSLKLLHSGGNGVIISAPSSNPAANRTITVPGNADGEMLTTTNPKTGNILQVVYAETTTKVSTVSGNYVDTGITATITPSSNSSKILVVVSLQWMLYREATETNGSFKLLRGSTNISEHSDAVHIEAGTTSQSRIISEGGYMIQKLDSPATTSATTYKVQFKTNVTANSASMDVNRNNAPGCITLMEVAG